jgi:hypothetical protein
MLHEQQPDQQQPDQQQPDQQQPDQQASAFTSKVNFSCPLMAQLLDCLLICWIGNIHDADAALADIIIIDADDEGGAAVEVEVAEAIEGAICCCG